MNQLKNPCVFLDRDGTVIVDRGYVYKIEDLEFMPGVLDGLMMLKKMGFLLVIITNQSGVARGFYALNDVYQFHSEMNARLYSLREIKIDAFYICPHYEHGIIEPFSRKCQCRKPSPYLLMKAAEEFQIDLSKSYMIGDKDCDVEAGRKAGLRNVFLVDNKHSFTDIAFHILNDVEVNTE